MKPASRRQGGRSLSAKVVVASGSEKQALLADALARSGFWSSLADAARRAGVAPAELRILVKPDLNLFDHGAPTGTDPELVEGLIDLLQGRGYRRVAVGAARSGSMRWLENRHPLVLADLVGYQFVTPRGREYEVIDLGDDLTETTFPAESPLYGRPLARSWLEAHYRIDFAKNKTDEEYLYALAVANLADVVPITEVDPPGRLRPADLCAELLHFTPVHFAIVDAFESNHGSSGTHRSCPLATRTLIVGENALLCDWVGALKMGLDPYGSTINARALKAIGLPEPYEIDGDLDPYPGWMNVHPAFADAVRRRNASPAMAQAFEPWLQSVNRELFPYKSLWDERINAALARILATGEGSPQTPWALAALNYLSAAARETVEGAWILYAKDRLHWQERPLGLDLSRYSPADYEAVIDYMAPLERLIQQLPKDERGLRWRYLDGSVLFEFCRDIPVPYESFASRVDISQSVRFMSDYIGGACVPVRRDRSGRVTHQAERNLYLVQPNYLVLSGGRTIDVAKLERVTYAKREQKISWKTLHSENGSALHDDGSVTFSKLGVDRTRVTVVGRQQFSLPLLWQAVNLDLHPTVKDFLVAHAYTTFFTQTMANFEAAYEGREFRVGSPAVPAAAGGDATVGRELGEALDRWSGRMADVGRFLAQILRRGPSPSAPQTDEDGFVHFAGQDGGSRGPDGDGTHPARAIDGAMRLAGRLLRRAAVEGLAFGLDLGEAWRKDLAASETEDDGRS